MPNKFRLGERRARTFCVWCFFYICRAAGHTSLAANALVLPPWSPAHQLHLHICAAKCCHCFPLQHVALIYCGWIRSQQITSHERPSGGRGSGWGVGSGEWQRDGSSRNRTMAGRDTRERNGTSSRGASAKAIPLF